MEESQNYIIQIDMNAIKLLSSLFDTKDEDNNTVRRIEDCVVFANFQDGLIFFELIPYDSRFNKGFVDFEECIDNLLNDVAKEIDIHGNGYSLIESEYIECIDSFVACERGEILFDFTITVDDFELQSVYIHFTEDERQYNFKLPFDIIPKNYDNFQTKINEKRSVLGF